jgi:hypothetical protein
MASRLQERLCAVVQRAFSSSCAKRALREKRLAPPGAAVANGMVQSAPVESGRSMDHDDRRLADYNAVMPIFGSLADRFEHMKTLLDEKPLLAHYTSVEVLEKIIQNKEIWFSNPLFMNDWEEMRFGMIEGMRAFHQSEAVAQAAGSLQRLYIRSDHSRPQRFVPPRTQRIRADARQVRSRRSERPSACVANPAAAPRGMKIGPLQPAN